MSRKEKTQDEIRTFNDKDFEMFSGITEMLVNTDIPQNAFAAADRHTRRTGFYKTDFWNRRTMK